MDIFILYVFYSFLYETFKVDVEDEGYPMNILSLFKAKNIIRFLVIFEFTAYICIDLHMFFKSLVLSSPPPLPQPV